jgi:hypothetical protein
MQRRRAANTRLISSMARICSDGDKVIGFLG